MAKKSYSSHDEPAEPVEEEAQAVEPLPPEPTPPAEPQEPAVHDGPVLSKEEARQLLHAGHKLGIKGKPKTEWFTTVRRLDQVLVAQALTEETESKLLDNQLILVE